MSRPVRIILWLYIALNLALALGLILDPQSVDATYRDGPMAVTGRFQWFSIGSFHLFMSAVTLASLFMTRAAERRWIHLSNAAFYLWDAASQALYWGAAVGLTTAELTTNAGVSAVVGVILLGVWRVDRRD